MAVLFGKARRMRDSEIAETLSGRKRSQWGDVLRRLARNKLAIIGMTAVILLVLSIVFAPFITPYDYAKQDLANRFAPLSWEHPLGTDNLGRDLLSRILYGGRVSLLVAIMAVCMSITVGIVVGSVAGFFGGKIETVIMRIMDVIMAIPQFLMAVCVSTALGGGLFNTALAISISAIPSTTRIMRANVMSIRDQEFVEAARAGGSGSARIIFRQILPNALAPIIVDCTLRLGASILAISSLSFVGLGVQPPTPEWGSILNAGRQYIRDYPPIVIFPGLAIMVTLFGFNLFGDGLRDALDPRLKQ